MNNLSIDSLNQLVNVDSLGGKTISREFQNYNIEKEMLANGLDVKSSSNERSFADLVSDSVNKVNEYQKNADMAIKELVAGRTKNIHETMLAIEQADLSLKLMTQVRNKVIEAYREIMRMQV